MPIPGANDASLTLTNVQPSFAASYTVTVTNVAGVINRQAASRWGATPAILEAVKQWETARMARAFPPPVKAALRDNTREFQLAVAGSGQWDLYEVHAARFTHDADDSAATEFQFQNRDAAQPLQWIIHSAAKQPLTGLTVDINRKRAVSLADRGPPAERQPAIRGWAGGDPLRCTLDGVDARSGERRGHAHRPRRAISKGGLCRAQRRDVEARTAYTWPGHPDQHNPR